MNRSRLLSALALLVATAIAGPLEARRLALSTIEGVVVSLQHRAGEGESELLAVELQGSDEHRTLVLLAPEESCREIGFEVEEGDRLRARVFGPEDGAAKAHKVLNLSRGTMVRFRTLRNIPLWTASGAWQGGPSRSQPGGAHAPRHRQSRPEGPGAQGGGLGAGPRR